MNQKENISPMKFLEPKTPQMPVKPFSCLQISVNCLLDDEQIEGGVETHSEYENNNCSPASKKYFEILEWFKSKGIHQGRPQQLLSKQNDKQKSKVRELIGNKMFLQRLNKGNSTLIKKRSEQWK